MVGAVPVVAGMYLEFSVVLVFVVLGIGFVAGGLIFGFLVRGVPDEHVKLMCQTNAYNLLH